MHLYLGIEARVETDGGEERRKGAFKNYVDTQEGWVGGHANVCVHKVNDIFLFTSSVYKGNVAVKNSKILST